METKDLKKNEMYTVRIEGYAGGGAGVELGLDVGGDGGGGAAEEDEAENGVHAAQEIEAGRGVEILGLVAKLARISFNDNELSLVATNPLLVAFVQTLKVVEPDGLLVVAATLLYLCD